VKIRVNAAKFHSENGRKVKIKGSERGEHRSPRQHDVKMADNVERVVKQDIHTGVGYAHTANTAGHEKENKGEREQERKFHSKRTINSRNASVHNFCCCRDGNHNS